MCRRRSSGSSRSSRRSWCGSTRSLDRQNAEFDARLNTLEAQRAHTQAQQQQRIDARIAELKSSHEARKAKLEEARRLAKQSDELARQSVGTAAEALVP